MPGDPADFPGRFLTGTITVPSAGKKRKGNVLIKAYTIGMVYALIYPIRNDS
jgi:hypothetical protein